MTDQDRELVELVAESAAAKACERMAASMKEQVRLAIDLHRESCTTKFRWFHLILVAIGGAILGCGGVPAVEKLFAILAGKP